MSTLGLPGINITFRERGISAISRLKIGILAVVLQDKNIEGNFNLFSISDIPKELSEENKDQITLAFMGYQIPPRKIILVVEKQEGEVPQFDMASDTFKYLESIRWNYLAIPFIDDTFALELSTWIKSLRDTKLKKVKAILPNIKGNHEGIINYTMPEVSSVAGTYKTNEYLTRVAGFCAGTPPQIAPTFGSFPELISCTNYTRDEIAEKIGNGEFVLMNDGDKIKCARGVNSLTDIGQLKGESFRKIKIVDIMDIIHDDIKQEAEDNYLGKYANSYDNKVLLMGAIKGYLMQLENDGLIARGSSHVEINIEAQTAYLKSIGYKTNDGRTVDDMEIKEIKEADTKDKVFILAKCKILDAIEEIDLPILI